MRRALPLAPALTVALAGCGLLPRATTPPAPETTVTYVDLPPAAPAQPPPAAELMFPLAEAAPCSRGFLPDERHFALDLVAPEGTPVLASAAGVVLRASWHRDYGLMVVVEHAGATYTLYAHLSWLAVSLGDAVAARGVLGAVGATGNARGAHLHWEVLRADAPLAVRTDGPLGVAGGAYRVDPAAVAAGIPASCVQRSSSPTDASSSLAPAAPAPRSRSAAFTASRSSDDVGP
jgi:murein DD-endopeptidase MepM/ murein hydrolase activator NlpD